MKVYRKSLILMLIISLVLLASGFSNNSPLVSGVDPKRIIEVGEGVYKIVPTEEEVQKYYELKGIDVSLNVTEYNQSDFKDFKEVKRETVTDERGIVTDEYVYYVPINQDVKINTDDPGEGALRIHYNYPNPRGSVFFDSKAGYRAYLQQTRYAKSFEMISGTFSSNIIYSFFTGAVKNLIDAGASGRGDAYSSNRIVSKYGQVYTGGTWRTYFTTEQLEVYWSHKQTATESNGNVRSSTFDYFPNSYQPIEWVPMRNYNNNTYILNVARSNYERGWPPSYDHGYEGTYFRNVWN